MKRNRLQLVIVGLFLLILAVATYLVWDFDLDDELGLEGGSDPTSARITQRPNAKGAEEIVSNAENDDRALDSISVVVKDKVSGRHLPGVALIRLGEPPQVVATSNKLGFLQLAAKPELDVVGLYSVSLPEHQGATEHPVKIELSGNQLSIVVPVYARLIVRILDPTIAGLDEGGEEARVWCASWPRPEEAIVGEIEIFHATTLRQLYGMRKLYSDTFTSGRLGVPYHDFLRRNKQVDNSKLQTASGKITSDETVLDILYSGEVVVDHFRLSTGVTKSVVTVNRGDETMLDIRLPQKIIVGLQVNNDDGVGVPSSKVGIVVRRELEPSELPPGSATGIFTPAGSSRRIAFDRIYGMTDKQGFVQIPLGFGGEIYAYAGKSGLVSQGRILNFTGEDSAHVIVLSPSPSGTMPCTLQYHGVPLPLVNIVISVADPVKSFFHPQFGEIKTNDQGKLLLDMLKVGNKYFISAMIDGKDRQKQFTYDPGKVIDIDG